MNTIKSKLATSVLLLLGCATGAAHACDVKDQKVLEVMTDDVGVYDDKGTWTADVKKAEIPLNQNILQCKDSPAMVQVMLTPDKQGNPRTGWVNLLEVKVGGTALVARKCKPTAVSQANDTIVPATSGIDPCSNNKK